MDTTINESKQISDTIKLSHTCKYCAKTYSRESVLAAHLCEKKRRWQQENEVGVRLGLTSYLRFYELTQGSAKLKTYEDFVNSPYYNAFVKFGRHLVSIRAINISSFTDWLLNNNKKLDHWCKDSLYSEWLSGYIKRESVQDAMERALKEMQDYAELHPELKNGFNDYFRYGNSNRICQHISTGRISPWVVYNCDTGIAFLDSLTEDQIEIVMPWLDPDIWQRKFKDHMGDTEWAKHILKQAGL
jgi:hypothetical protein